MQWELQRRGFKCGLQIERGENWMKMARGLNEITQFVGSRITDRGLRQLGECNIWVIIHFGVIR